MFVFAVISFRTGNRKASVTLMLMIFVTLFGLTLLQGVPQPYRTCQTFPVFVAFVSMLWFARCKYRRLGTALVMLVVVFQMKELCFWQAYDLETSRHTWHTILSIERDLKQIPDIAHKKIIVRGSPEIKFDPHRLPVPFNLKNHFSFTGEKPCPSSGILSGYQFCILMRRYTDLSVEHFNRTTPAVHFPDKMPTYPQTGYIVEAGDFVIVNLGEQVVPTGTGVVNGILKLFRRRK